MKKLAIACAIGLACTHAIANNWYVLSATVRKDRVTFVTDGRLTTSGVLRTMWSRTYFRPTTEKHHYEQTQYEARCGQSQVRVVSLYRYDQNQRFVGSISEPTPFLNVAPDTVGDAIYRVMCESKFPAEQETDDYRLVGTADKIEAFNSVYFEHMLKTPLN